MDRKIDARRAIDIGVSGTILVAFSVPMAFTWLAIKLTAPSEPALFRQTRYGLNNEPFTIYKFRSMKDGHKTRIGSMLRKCAFDESPQFWNILKNEMSIVGPRPDIVKAPIEGWEKRVEGIKPGFGCSSDLREKMGTAPVTYEEHLRGDLEYIDYRRTHGKMRNFGYDIGLVCVGLGVLQRLRADHGKLLQPEVPKPALVKPTL